MRLFDVSILIRVLALGCALGLCMAAGPSHAKDDTDLLRFIRHFEAKGSYDIYYVGIRQPPPKRLTEMSVGEVLAWQKSLRRTKSTAAGGYQFIRPTLNDIVQRHNIPLSTRFDAALQDRMALHLIDDCSAARARGAQPFGNCLAGIWAALPLVSGPKRGRSAHHGVAGNRALTTPENFLAVLKGLPYRMPAPSRTRVARHDGHETTTPRYVQIRDAMRQTNQAGQGAGTRRVWSIDPYATE